MGTNRRPARRRCSIAYWAASSVKAWVRVPSVHRYSPPTARPRPGCQLSHGQSRCGHAYPTPEAATSCAQRSEEHTSELQSLMRISYAVFCLKKKTTDNYIKQLNNIT